MRPLNALNALAHISPSGMLGRRQSGDNALLAGLEPGQRLQARVQSNLVNGEFAVALNRLQVPPATGGQTVHMRLPAGTHLGDLLNMIFVSQEPRPTFMLTLESQVPQNAVTLLVSRPGLFVDQLLRLPVSPGSLATLSSEASLLAGSPANAVLLARSLASALDRSGLFYESHQAEWVSGKRSLPELLLEPQAQLPALTRSIFASSADPSGTMGTTDSTMLLRGAKPGMEGAAAASAANAITGMSDLVHPASLAMVRQQLEILETRQFSLQGMAWPGQVMTWEAAEEKLEGQKGGKEEDTLEGPGQSPPRWQTCLHLTLPSLGQITANLRLDMRGECGVEMRLIAAEPMAIAALRAAVTPLANGLESAGIKLRSIRIAQDEEA